MKLHSAQRMSTEPLIPMLFSFSIPIMLSLLVQATYNVVDSFYISRISEHGITALSLAFPIQTIIVALAGGIGIGANILIAHSLGESDRHRAHMLTVHSLFLCIVAWIILAMVILPLLKLYFAWFTTNTITYDMGITYTWWIVFFSGSTFIEQTSSRILHATGCTRLPMIFQIIGSVINILLDPILIFGWFGFPSMGILGAAVATIVGQVTSALLSSVSVFRRLGVFPSMISKITLQYRLMVDIFIIGFPSVLGITLVSFYVTGLNAVLSGFSETAVAVLGIYYKLQTFLLMPTYGLNQAITSIMSYNYGARLYNRMWKTLWYSLALSTVTLVLGTVVFWMYTSQLLQIFVASDEMMRIGIPALRIISTSFPLFGITILMPTLFQVMKYMRLHVIITLLREVVLLVPIAWILSYIGLRWVWLTFPISEIIAALVCFYYIIKLYKKCIK